MFGSLARAIFGTANDRSLKAYQRRVPEINALEAEIAALDDVTRCVAKTDEFRGRIAGGTTLDELLPEAFAVTREAARRVLGMRPFRRAADRRHGAACRPHRRDEDGRGARRWWRRWRWYLNALAGKGVHVVTVNDYLARRDADEMGRLYAFLGPVHRRDRAEPQPTTSGAPPTRADVTYGTNNEFGFDYPARQHEIPAGGHGPARRSSHAIVDEVGLHPRSTRRARR